MTRQERATDPAPRSTQSRSGRRDRVDRDRNKRPVGSQRSRTCHSFGSARSWQRNADRELGASAHVELAEDRTQMGLDRARAEEQVLGDLAIRAAARDLDRDPQLGARQRSGDRRRQRARRCRFACAAPVAHALTTGPHRARRTTPPRLELAARTRASLADELGRATIGSAPPRTARRDRRRSWPIPADAPPAAPRPLRQGRADARRFRGPIPGRSPGLARPRTRAIVARRRVRPSAT